MEFIASPSTPGARLSGRGAEPSLPRNLWQLRGAAPATQAGSSPKQVSRSSIKRMIGLDFSVYRYKWWRNR